MKQTVLFLGAMGILCAGSSLGQVCSGSSAIGFTGVSANINGVAQLRQLSSGAISPRSLGRSSIACCPRAAIRPKGPAPYARRCRSSFRGNHGNSTSIGFSLTAP